MFFHAQSLKLSVATFTLALAAAGCGSQDPGVPGSGIHASSGGGSGGGSSSGASGGGSNSGSGGSSSGGSGGSSGAGASSGGSGGGASSGGTTTGNESWADGKQISGNFTIAAGDTVTIVPGATVTVAAGASITVAGTLTGSSVAPTHAKLTGTGWTGLVIAKGGSLTLDGVDLSNTAVAIEAQTGAGKVEFDTGTIDASSTPFSVATGATLGLQHVMVTNTKGPSRVAGLLVASFIDYNSNGNAGITTTDPGAKLSFEDSKLHGTGPTTDFVVSGPGAASIHVAYSTISNVHCGFHFDSITAFDISYSDIQSNAYGFMLYGSSGAGPRSVTHSNIVQNTAFSFDTTGTNGPITFDSNYINGGQQTTNNVVSVTNAQVVTVPGTGPRGAI